MAQKALFIVNPVSGGADRDFEEHLAKEMGDGWIPYRVVRTQYAGHAEALAREATEDLIVAVGGDGTVNEVARGIASTAQDASAGEKAVKTLGIIPCGSGNGLAFCLGIKKSLKQACEVLREGKSQKIDMGMMNGRPFFCSCGAGLDADVSLKFASSKTRGLATYVSDAIKIWKRFEPQRYEVEVDGVTTEVPSAVLITIGNANQWGNNALIAPGASLSDGILEVTIIHKFHNIDIPALAVKLFDGNIYHSASVTHLRGRHIVIRRERPGAVHCDGDPFTDGTEISVSIQPAALSAVCLKLQR